MDRISDRLDTLTDKIDDNQRLLLEKITAILVAQAINGQQLTDNLRRMEILEQDIKPLKAHRAMVIGAVKVGGGLLSLTAATVGIMRAAGML